MIHGMKKKEGVDYYILWKYLTKETFSPKNHLEAGDVYGIFLQNTEVA